MKEECWINVYKYPNSKLFYSYCIKSKETAILYSSKKWNNRRKTLYRIHIKMKGPKIVCKVNCRCGTIHTFEKWQKCPSALIPLEIKNDY